jgi:hypothetical protein
MLGFIPLGRAIGATGTTILLVVVSALIIYAGFNLKQY